MRVGDRVEFNWFGKRIVGELVLVPEQGEGIECEVYSGLRRRTYSVDFNDVRACPLHEGSK